MKKVLVILFALMFCLVPFTVMAGEGPMKLPMVEGSNADATMHNDEGIAAWGKGDYAGALKHFSMASKIDSSKGETHFNEAICLDKLGKHGDATMHFRAAKKNAGGNKAILNSGILNAHLGG